MRESYHQPGAPVGGAGLLLMGGGARTAYQAGVISAIAGLVPDGPASPFDKIAGTSAGAINGAFLAASAGRWPLAAAELCELWRGLTPERVFSTEWLDWYLRGARWISWLAVPRLMRSRPESLLDNAPLVRSLHEAIDVEAIEAAIDAGTVDYFAVTASSYTSGRHVTFYRSGRALRPWMRPGRIAVAARIGVDHLVASAALPFVFAPVALPIDGGTEYFGDGTMRQSTPLSPLIHAGADRILAIGAGPGERAGLFERGPGHPGAHPGKPTLAQIAGHALASVMFDALPADVEQMERANEALALIPPDLREAFPFRPVEIMTINPSRPIEELALEHIRELPPRVRAFLRTFGGTEQNGMALASYLLFEPSFTVELIALGRADALRRAAEIREFFGVRPASPPPRLAAGASASP
ncbi:MAG: patatin-like phospholipase family protein [Burkholderiaceae bacterium]